MKYLVSLTIPFLILGCGSEDISVTPAGPTDGWVHMIIDEEFQGFTTNVWSYQKEERSGLLDHDTKIDLNKSNLIMSSIKTAFLSEFEYIISLDDTINSDTWILLTSKLSENNNIYSQLRTWADHNSLNYYDFYFEAIDRNNFSIISEHQVDVGNITRFLALGSCNISMGDGSGVCTYTYDGTEITAEFDSDLYQNWFDLTEADKKVSDLALPLSLSINLDYYNTNQLTSIVPPQGQWIEYNCYNGICQKWYGEQRKILNPIEPISKNNINFFTKYTNTYTDFNDVTLDITEVTLSESNLDIEDNGWRLQTNVADNSNLPPSIRIQSRHYYQESEVTREPLEYEFAINDITNIKVSGSASLYTAEKFEYANWECNVTDKWGSSSCNIDWMNSDNDTTRIVNLDYVNEWNSLDPSEQSEIDIAIKISTALELTLDDLAN
ncbi:hypothetical protein QWZ04_21840 [Vibrio tapetis subsp. quintayensis]|uniref:hypothetical protein n=1 Tax=Vibrio tapetis TaxID=52443 RepID=UPI0025B4A5C5|nr:hypothetical protein [Vibrio tapetis]MDN3682951.1 hypothetical protein [Vibrio tapetis subsp. quintayensis]